MNKIETINDLLKNPQYDFSNEKATDAYCNKEGMEKFFAYMTYQHKNNFPMDNIDILFQEAAQKVKEKAINYGTVIDADSQSTLLQEIYKILWSEDTLQFCKNKNSITGDTLNSVNRTLNLYYTYLEDEFDKGKEEIETEKYKGIFKNEWKGKTSSINKIYFSKILRRKISSCEHTFTKYEFNSFGKFLPYTWKFHADSSKL